MAYYGESIGHMTDDVGELGWSVYRDLGMFGREIGSLAPFHGQTPCSYEHYLVLIKVIDISCRQTQMCHFALKFTVYSLAPSRPAAIGSSTRASIRFYRWKVNDVTHTCEKFWLYTIFWRSGKCGLVRKIIRHVFVMSASNVDRFSQWQ